MINLKRLENLAQVKALLAECMWPDDERITQEIYAYKMDDSRGLWGKTIDHELVGLIGTDRITSGEVVLRHIAVKESYRNEGIGTNLIQAYIKENKIRRMMAETDTDAVHFYKRIGFEISSLGEKYPGRERFACVLKVE